MIAPCSRGGHDRTVEPVRAASTATSQAGENPIMVNFSSFSVVAGKVEGGTMGRHRMEHAWNTLRKVYCFK